LFLLSRLGLPKIAVALGAWSMAFASPAWSVATITPDLLSAGIICFALGVIFSNQWLQKKRWQCLAGGIWALAYYAKAISLPLSLFCCVGLGVWRMIRERLMPGTAIRGVALTLSIVIVLTAPWVALLSTKYHRLTISTAARAARALVCPKEQRSQADHDWRFGEHVPEAGRISFMESFDVPPAWSPLGSFQNAKHQFRLIFENAFTISEIVKGFDFLSLGVTSSLVAFILLVFHRTLRASQEQKWLYSLLPMFGLCGIYWTTYCNDPRFYWVLLPLLLATSFGLAGWATRQAGLARLAQYAIYLLVAASFILPPARYASHIISHRSEETEAIPNRDMARRLQAAGLAGPIASSTEELWRAGFYVAFFLNQPWYGDLRPPTVEQFRKSKAKLIIVGRQEPVARDLAADSHFRDLDTILFRDPQTASQCALKAFELLH
jgi:hypothetical protein